MQALPAMLAALLALVGPALPAAVRTPPPAPPPAPAPAPAAPGRPPARRGGDPARQPPQAPFNADYEFERGKTAFSRAEYERAIGILQPLLYPETRLDSEGAVVQAHRMLGVAHLFENRPDDARREFRKLLELRPDYRFDPLLDPPRVVEFFNDVLKEEENEIASLEAKRRKRDADLAARRQEEADRRCRTMMPPIRYEKHSYAINFLPFGAGQFQNGQRRKAWAFFGAEAILGAVSVAAFSSNFILFGFSPRRKCLDPQSTSGTVQKCMNIDHSEEDLSRNLLRLQLASGGLFAIVAIAGVVDAIRNFQDEVLLAPQPAPPSPSPSATDGASAPATAISRAASTRRTKVRMLPTPFPLANGAGLGLAWTF